MVTNLKLYNLKIILIGALNKIGSSTLDNIKHYLDGTLVKSSGKYTQPYWGETEGIKENINFLNELYDTGKVYIILTTARSSSARDVTLKQLEREGIKYDNIIFDLFHANRTIINDYGTSNPYPTCDAVNLVRNSNELERFLKDLGK